MTTTRLNRRRFLTVMGVGGAAAAAAVVNKQAGESRERVSNSPQHGKGYQLTKHVRRYYETTKV